MTDKTKPDILVRDGKELYAHTLLLKVRSLGINRPSRVKYVSPGVPCGLHPVCLSHASHPCEGCGRIAGRWLPFTPDHPAWEAWEQRWSGILHSPDVSNKILDGLYRWRECEACEGGIIYTHPEHVRLTACESCLGQGWKYERADA